ncbi:MAG: GH92 family glycosyl hydrolase, partial [Deltaproteobacteria bacterium]
MSGKKKIFPVLFVLILSLAAFLVCGDNGEQTDIVPLIDYVNPFIGTGGVGYGVGSTFPGPTLPFGMVKLSPDTTDQGNRPDFAHCGGYWYRDPEIRGFTHTHFSGTGAADYGNILLMPTLGIGDQKTLEEGYRSTYRHDTEAASPGYYAVTLDNYSIRVELTATEHAGYHRYTFPESDEAYVLIDVGASIVEGASQGTYVEITPQESEVTGWVDYVGGLSGRSGGFRLYFSARFRKPFSSYGVWSDGTIYPGENIRENKNVGAYVGYAVQDNEPIEVKVGISYISIEQARLNLKSEITDWDFEGIRQKAEDAWREALSSIEVRGGDEDERMVFATAMYHSLIMPTLFTEVNGQYLGFDRNVHSAEGFRYYSDLSLWDTFRTLHPLLVLIEPERQRDMVISLVKMKEQGGWIPKWPAALGYTNCMIGTSADIMIADTYLKGIQDFDVEKAYAGMRETAMAPTPPVSPYEGRGGISLYVDLGYLPSDQVGDATSKTLEFAYDDWAISQLARALGKEEDHELFKQRSMNYRNLWDPITKYIRGKNSDGLWVEPFDPEEFYPYYTEGNAWHWSWYAPHDPEGLINLFGSKDAFVDRLDTFFALSSLVIPEEGVPENIVPDPYYWHGNEPDIHAAYLFNHAGRPDKTQEWVRKVMEEKYGTGPDGLAGNDDCGTLSAWYIFSALGFYPVAGGEMYLIGSPIFKRATIHLGTEEFTIIADNASKENKYVNEAMLNDIPLTEPWFRHS